MKKINYLAATALTAALGSNQAIAQNQEIDCNSSDAIGPYSEFTVQFSKGNSYEELNNLCPAGARHLEKLLVSKPLDRNGKIDGNESLALANEVEGCPLNGENQTTFSVAIDDISMSPKNTSLLKTECRVPRKFTNTKIEPKTQGVTVVVTDSNVPDVSIESEDKSVSDSNVPEEEQEDSSYAYALPSLYGSSNKPFLLRDDGSSDFITHYRSTGTPILEEGIELDDSTIMYNTLKNAYNNDQKHPISTYVLGIDAQKKFETRGGLEEFIKKHSNILKGIISETSCLSERYCDTFTEEEMDASLIATGIKQGVADAYTESENYSLRELSRGTTDNELSSALNNLGLRHITPVNSIDAYNTGGTDLRVKSSYGQREINTIVRCNDDERVSCLFNAGKEIGNEVYRGIEK